jgi:hypothetical protein
VEVRGSSGTVSGTSAPWAAQSLQQPVAAVGTDGEHNEKLQVVGGIAQQISEKRQETPALAGILRREQLFGLVNGQQQSRRSRQAIADLAHLVCGARS